MNQGGEENKKWWVVLADRSVSYHPAFSRLAGGSAAAGVFLSQALYWQLRIPEKRPPGCPGPDWFWKSGRDWEEETALSRQQQETARAKLVQLGVLREKRCGVPARMFFKVDMDKLEELLKKQSVRKPATTKKEKKEEQPPPPKKKEEAAGEEIKEYLRLGLLYGGAGDVPPHTPGGWLYSAKKRIREQGGLSAIDRGQMAGWAKKEEQGEEQDDHSLENFMEKYAKGEIQ